MDSAQRELDNISTEPHEFIHLIPAYQVLASQSNYEVKQTLGLVHSEQSLRNAKVSMASASTTAIEDSKEDIGATDLEHSSKEEGDEWFYKDYFTYEDIQDEVKAQCK